MWVLYRPMAQLLISEPITVDTDTEFIGIEGNRLHRGIVLAD